MEGKKPKSPGGGRLARAALFVAVAGFTVGGMVLGTGPAHAAVGTALGDLTFSPTTGSVNSSPTWSTTEGCPSGFNGSAIVRWVESDGTTFSISGTVESPTSALSDEPMLGTPPDDISEFVLLSGIADGGQNEIDVDCYSGDSLTGTEEAVMYTYIDISSDGSTYTITNTPQVTQTATTTTLTSSNTSPTTCGTGSSVTLSATVTAADETTPAGTVQFEADGTDIGSPVSINSGGTASTATTTTTFTSAGSVPVTAVFTATSDTYATSTSNTVTEAVTAGTGCNTGAEPISVTVPATGTFTLTVPTGTVTLAVAGSTATGTLNTITVSDTRNTFPGWSVSGQESVFTGTGTAAGSTISGDQLGWVPTDTSLATGATLGPTVAPGTDPGGLGDTAAVLASAAPGGGAGTSGLGANLTLDIPATAEAGPYGGNLTITAVTTGP
jgi:hypothetical protein